MSNFIEANVSGMPKRRTFLDFIIQQPLGFIGLILIIIMFLGAIFASEISPYHPEDIDFEASPALGGRQHSFAHLLLSSSFGRDILSRLI